MRAIICCILMLFHSWVSAEVDNEAAEMRAWREFTSQLGAAGAEILRTYPQPGELDSAEGLRYLLQQLGSSIEAMLVEQPGQIPLLRIGATTINKWGLDGADAKYQGARIRGDGRYRLSGRLGSARLFALQLTRMKGTYDAYGALTGDQLGANRAGEFEVLISAEKPPDWKGAWLELDSSADSLLIREYFSDWTSERPGRYYLEQLAEIESPGPVTLGQITTLLEDTALKFASRAPQWQGRVEQARQHLVNKVHMQKADGQGLASNAYGSGWFRVGNDQALVIEMDAPEALLWSVQLGNVWWESLDYINHTASYNDSQAVAGSDGKYRFVISQQDPGVPNWLDPAGHQEGALMFRLQEARAMVHPRSKLVSFKSLAEHLPGDTPKVSAEQRQGEIKIRRVHASVRWAP